MNYKSVLFGVMPLICAGLLIPQYGAAATNVTVNNQSCGTLTSLETTPGQVTLSVDGDCGSGSATDTPANVADYTLPAVTEGTTATKDVSTGVIVQLPYTVSIATQPGLTGASATVSGNVVTYYAPPVGTVAADGTPDSFTYRIADGSTAPNSVTGTISVTVNKGDVNSNGACVNSATIVCRTPDLDISTTGEFRYLTRDAGVTDVWTIPPGKRQTYEANIGIRYVTASSLPVTISLSENYAADSTANACTIVVDREEGYLVWYSETLSYRCLLDPAKTYYFRVSGAKTGSYWLVW
ncbi:hypothetical protein [Thiolapillus sp.]